MRAAAAQALRTIPRALPSVSLSLSPRARLRLLGALAALLVLACAYLVWFRESSFVRVEEVTVTGLSVDDAPRIRAALTDAARGMTTLHVREDDLRHAVAGYAVVHDLRVSADFPHGLRIEVLERRPVAVLVAAGQRVPVAADGTVLRGVDASAALPPVPMRGSVPRHRLGEGEAMMAVSVIAAAPDALAPRIEAVEGRGARGLVVELRDGPEVILGDSGRLAAKWAAATRVLADPAADGATYVDVRLPERPVAGGLAAEPSADAVTDAPAAGAAAPAPATPAPEAPAEAPSTGAPTTGAPPTSAAPVPATPAPGTPAAPAPGATP